MMNRLIILNTMNYEYLTKKQLTVNSDIATTTTGISEYAVWAANYAAEDADDETIEYWLNEYFMATGESLADYEVELSRDNSFREVS